MNQYYLPLLGGALIGIAVSLMLLFNGRVTGVSGIVNGALKKPNGDVSWRWAFIFGLLAGGVLLGLMRPEVFTNDLNRSVPVVVIAGLLVGYGTVMGSGCTSGHGICGIARLSPRSIVATLLFMAFGIVTATLFRVMTGVS
jgi:uncharacterized protein